MIIDEEDYLTHYGVKGMQWGVRSSRPDGVSRRVNREARKDAEEFARAKAFYGTGAGTRRKLIKQTVEGKTKRIPGYKTAFDKHLDDQDTSKHVSKAIGERKRKDISSKTTKTAGAIARRFTGEMGTQAAFVAVAAGGIAFARSPQGQAVMKKSVKTVVNAAEKFKQQHGARVIADMLRRT